MKNLLCADCGCETLESLTEIESFNYKGHTLSVEVEYSLCSQCGAEAILPDQIKRNDTRTRNAWRKADGLLTGEEIVALRKQLGLTQQQAARMFGGGSNAFSKYERGEVIQSEAMDKLMRLSLESQPVNVSKWLNDRAGLQKPELQASYGNIIPFRSKSRCLKVHSYSSDVIEVFDDVNYG